jgi:hypothetical protein
MNMDKYLMLNFDDIDYVSLTEDQLKDLSVAGEPFIATYALAELTARKSPLTRQVAYELLMSKQTDEQLRASALEALFKEDQAAFEGYVTAHLEQMSEGLFRTVLEILSEEQPSFSTTSSTSLVHAVHSRLAHDREKGVSPMDREHIETFQKMYDASTENDGVPASARESKA